MSNIHVTVTEDGAVLISKNVVQVKDFGNVEGFIAWLFNYRCVGLDDACYKQARDISHIIPKSRGKIARRWENLVLHCVDCHSEYHRRGASDENIQKLKERRIEHLETLGRSEYE